MLTVIPRGEYANPRSGYVAQVLRTKTTNPGVKVTVDAQKDITIIKLDGLDKVPADDDLNR